MVRSKVIQERYERIKNEGIREGKLEGNLQNIQYISDTLLVSKLLTSSSVKFEQ